MIRMKLFAICFVVVFAALFFFWTFRAHTESAHLTLEIAPAKGSHLTVDGKGYRAGKSSFKPGTYSVVMSHPGFTTVSQQIRLAKGDNQYFGAALVPDTRATTDWYNKNPKDEKLAEGISSNNADQLSKFQAASMPLVKDLPFVDQFYRIDYGPSLKYPKNPSKVAIYVKYYSQQGKQQADDWLGFKGYDPAKLEIYYKAA